IAIFIHHVGFDGWQWACRAAWLQRLNDRGADQNHTGFCLPPGIHDWQLVMSDVVAIPHPGFGINWLSYRTKQAQAGEIVFGGPFLAEAHQATNGRRGRIKYRYLEFLDDAPESIRGRIH